MKAHRAEFPLTAMCRVLGLVPQRVLRLAEASALGSERDATTNFRAGSKRSGGIAAKRTAIRGSTRFCGSRASEWGRSEWRGLGRQAPPRRGAGCLEPSHRRLGDGDSPAGRTGRGRAGDGDLAPPAEGAGDPSLRPGLAIHLARLREAVPGSWDPPADGFGGGCVRQRQVREPLRDLGMRTVRPVALPDRSRGAEGSLRLHRGLLHHPSNPLGPRLPGTRELRGHQPCRLKRTCDGATNRPRPLPPPLEGTRELISDTINHRNQPFA